VLELELLAAELLLWVELAVLVALLPVVVAAPGLVLAVVVVLAALVPVVLAFVLGLLVVVVVCCLLVVSALDEVVAVLAVVALEVLVAAKTWGTVAKPKRLKMVAENKKGFILDIKCCSLRAYTF
jgi:hypothetical protein